MKKKHTKMILRNYYKKKIYYGKTVYANYFQVQKNCHYKDR